MCNAVSNISVITVYDAILCLLLLFYFLISPIPNSLPFGNHELVLYIYGSFCFIHLGVLFCFV